MTAVEYPALAAAAQSWRSSVAYPTRESELVARPTEIRLVSAGPWAFEVIDSLNRLMGLRDNWDHRGSRSVNRDDALAVLSFLGRLMQRDTVAPSIGPLNSGGLELTWRADGLEVEAVFDSRRDEQVLYVTAGSHETEEPIESAEKLFLDVRPRLTGR